jgi:hypothetical protein
MDVKVPVSIYALISGIKFNIVCSNNPNHSWGVYLNADGSLPEGWDVCIKCFSNKRQSNMSVKGDVKNNGNTIFK